MERAGTAETRPRANLLPILTLFLLLLAFFVVLGTISKFEENRTQVVLGSLKATFRTTDPLGERREFGSLSGQIIGAEKLESRLDLALRTAVGVDRFELERVGNRLTLTLPVANLFQADSIAPVPGLTDLADLVSDALSLDVPGVEIRPEVYVSQRGDVELAAGRAVAVGHSFVASGVDPNRLAVGLRQDLAGLVEIVFRVVPVESST